MNLVLPTSFGKILCEHHPALAAAAANATFSSSDGRFPGAVAATVSPSPGQILSKISNITNSSDPTSIIARVFVGNLNTFAIAKDDVEQIFLRYGRIIGISMHKGYAFVQFTNEYNARNAVAGEDQRIYAGQQVDVNMAAEPKPNRPSRKRPPGAGAEWDYFYNVPVLPGRAPIHLPIKRARPDISMPVAVSAITTAAPVVPISPGPIVVQKKRVHVSATSPMLLSAGIKALQARLQVHRNKPVAPSPSKPVIPNYEDPDILICGTCKQVFPDVERLAAHKKVRCRLRFVCKCQDDPSTKMAKSECSEPCTLTCATCHMTFSSGWDLCQHCQADHGLSIYEETIENQNSVRNASIPCLPEAIETPSEGGDFEKHPDSPNGHEDMVENNSHTILNNMLDNQENLADLNDEVMEDSGSFIGSTSRHQHGGKSPDDVTATADGPVDAIRQSLDSEAMNNACAPNLMKTSLRVG